jgi:hypothetical protein
MALARSKASSYSQESSHLPNSHIIPGTEYIDTVTIAKGVVISQQSIGVASQSNGFYPFDGIMGCA